MYLTANMGKFTSILKQPFPCSRTSLRCLKSAAIAGFIVFFIIFFLKPFDFDRTPKNLILLHSLLYGTVTFIIVTINILLMPIILSKWFDETRWTVGKELIMMMLNILIISAGNVFLTHILYAWNFALSTFLVFLGYTSAVGIFPISILVLLKYITLLKKHQQVADYIEPLPQVQECSNRDNLIITLLGDYQNEVLEINASDILYISTADNYIKVFYLKNDSLVTTFLRSTLKKAEDTLIKFPYFFRCHRTHIVNLHKIKRVSGNAQGLKLHIEESLELIPVSRSLNQQLMQRMNNQKEQKIKIISVEP